MPVTSKGSGKTGFMRRLVGAFAGHLCNKYPFLSCTGLYMKRKVQIILCLIIFISYESAFEQGERN